MRKIAVFGVVFVAVALTVCLVSCSSPSAVIYFSVNGEIVRSQVVTETSGLDDSAPPLTDGTFKGWFTDEACTVPFSFHDYILSGTFEDITVYALISHDDTESNNPEIWEDACEHDLQHLAAKSSTCSARGNLECWYCSLCEHYYADEACTTYISPFLDRLGHETVFVSAKAETCTEDGAYEHWHCSRCGLDFEDEDCTVELTNAVISSSGHTLVHSPEEPSSCTCSGHLEYWTCSVCKDVFSERDALKAVPLESLKKELLPHSYSVEDIIELPSAAKSGSALLVCSCGDAATLTLPRLSYEDYSVVSVPSSCTKQGSDTYTLLGTYHVQIVETKSLAEHSRGAITDSLAPTCTEDGATGFVLCTQCGVVLSPSKPIPSAGHNWSESASPSTCTTQGFATKICSSCGETHTSLLPLADHSFEYVQQLPSSCIQKGVSAHYECSSCHKLFTLGKEACTEQELALPLSRHSLDPTGVCSVCGNRELQNALFEPNDSGVTFTGFLDGYIYPYTELVIPSSYNGLPVTEIASDAFTAYQKSVTSLVLPDSLLSLPEGVLSVFADYDVLQSLTLPFIGTSRDEGCVLIKLFDADNRNNASLPESLKSVTVTDAKIIYANTLSAAVNLTEICINEGCTSIEAGAFAACRSLETLRLPSSLQSLDSRALRSSFTEAASPTIRFAGTQEQWDRLTANLDLPETTTILIGELASQQ